MYTYISLVQKYVYIYSPVTEVEEEAEEDGGESWGREEEEEGGETKDEPRE